MLQLNGHPQRSKSPTLRSKWRRASQPPKAGRCTFLGGRRTWHVFYLPRLQLPIIRLCLLLLAYYIDVVSFIITVDDPVFRETGIEIDHTSEKRMI